LREPALDLVDRHPLVVPDRQPAVGRCARAVLRPGRARLAVLRALLVHDARRDLALTAAVAPLVPELLDQFVVFALTLLVRPSRHGNLPRCAASRSPRTFTVAHARVHRIERGARNRFNRLSVGAARLRAVACVGPRAARSGPPRAPTSPPGRIRDAGSEGPVVQRATAADLRRVGRRQTLAEPRVAGALPYLDERAVAHAAEVRAVRRRHHAAGHRLAVVAHVGAGPGPVAPLAARYIRRVAAGPQRWQPQREPERLR